jgi:transcriptional regulator
MYVPPAFRDDDPASLHGTMRAVRLCNFVTATAEGLIATPLPLLLDDREGPHGVLYGHVARANPQWKSAPIGDAMAIFMGPDAYVTPSWYATKQETGKVVPTWNYVAIHAYGPVEFFEDADRLLDVVKRLTDLHGLRPRAWCRRRGGGVARREPVGRAEGNAA